MIKAGLYFSLRARRRAGGQTTVGLDDANRTGNTDITSDEGNPSTIDYINVNAAAYYHLGASGGIAGDFDFEFTIPTA